MCIRDSGYGIMSMTRQLSGGEVRIGSGTMYGATGNLMKKGWIEEIFSQEPGEERRRLYRLTGEGREALLERVIFRLTAHRGQFPFLEDLGSQLWRLGRVGSAGRQAAAEQYVTEALKGEEGLTVESVALTQELSLIHI